METKRRSGANPPLDGLIDQCLQVYRACASALVRPMSGHLRPSGEDGGALQDCADVSLTLANLLIRKSRHHRPMLPICRDVAMEVADEVEDAAHGDATLRATHVACRRLVTMCEALIERSGVTDDAALEEALMESFPASDPVPPPTTI